MKNFFAEFKKFITRGNVIDMSIGVIVGGAFTAIVNGMSNFILKPLINYFLVLTLGANSLSEVFTFLTKVYTDVVDDAGQVIGQEIDLTQSIYIDWGSFINAVINFLITAFVLFLIVRMVNRMRDEKKGKFTREQKQELKANGIKACDKEAAAAYFAAKKAAEDAAAAEKARLDREANPTTEDLLKQILAEMKKA